MQEWENPESALLREIKEETGLDVIVREPFNVYTFENEKKEFKVGITFICDYVHGQVVLSDEHLEFVWIDSLDIKKYNTSEGLTDEIVRYANKYNKSYEKFNVSQKAVIIRDNKCFIAEISKRLGTWDLPGGRIDRREDYLSAFRRELKEEIGVSDYEVLATYDCDSWISRSGAAVYGTVSLIRTDEEMRLSDEHTQGKWISENEIEDYEYIWPVMGRMIKKGFWYNEILGMDKQPRRKQ